MQLVLTYLLILITGIAIFELTAAAYGETADQVTKLLLDGDFLYSQNNYGQALSYFESALKIESNNTYAMNRIGVILYDIGYVNEGLAYFDRALEVEPNNTRTLISKGYALGLLGNFTEAIKYFDMALEVHPNSVNALFSKGEAFAKIN